MTCEGPLTPYAHWAICPNCEPGYHNMIKPPVVVPVDPLKDKGVPTRNGKRYA